MDVLDVHGVGNGLGTTVDGTAKNTETPGKRLETEGEDRNAHSKVVLTFEPIPEGTRLTYAADAEGRDGSDSGFARKGKAGITHQGRRQILCEVCRRESVNHRCCGRTRRIRNLDEPYAWATNTLSDSSHARPRRDSAVERTEDRKSPSWSGNSGCGC